MSYYFALQTQWNLSLSLHLLHNLPQTSHLLFLSSLLFQSSKPYIPDVCIIVLSCLWACASAIHSSGSMLYPLYHQSKVYPFFKDLLGQYFLYKYFWIWSRNKSSPFLLGTLTALSATLVALVPNSMFYSLCMWLFCIQSIISLRIKKHD